VNPPLIRTLAAIPTWLSSARRDWSHYLGGQSDRPEFRVGWDFIANNGRQTFRYFTWGRIVCIPFSVLTGWLCYRWSSDLYGRRAGLVAATLWCFLPEAISNGQLITPDSGATCIGLAFWYSYWRWQRSPNWLGILVLAVLLGLAVLAKTTWLVAYPLVLLTWMAHCRHHSRAGNALTRWVPQLTTLLVVSIYVINLGYLFEGTGRRLGDYSFLSSTLRGETTGAAGNRFADSWIAQLPVPLPKNFVLGIDMQKYEFDDKDYDSYLRGTWRKQGWWYYYLYGLAIKTPLGCWGLLAMASLTRGERRPRFIAAPLLLPGLAIIVLVSSQTGFNHHLRYVLPAMPYLLILASRVFARFPVVCSRYSRARGRVAAALVCWSITSSLTTFPHSQSFFNESMGGPCHGPRHLLNSNVDWGQDVFRVRQWLEKHPEAAPLHYAPYCNFDINAAAPNAPWIRMTGYPLRAGWYALSVNELNRPDQRYSTFSRLAPVAFVGYSTHVFHLSASDIRGHIGLSSVKDVQDFGGECGGKGNCNDEVAKPLKTNRR
jgi:hypothetical protein